MQLSKYKMWRLFVLLVFAFFADADTAFAKDLNLHFNLKTYKFKKAIKKGRCCIDVLSWAMVSIL